MSLSMGSAVKRNRVRASAFVVVHVMLRGVCEGGGSFFFVKISFWGALHVTLRLRWQVDVAKGFQD